MDKNQKSLEDYGVKDNEYFVYDFADRPQGSAKRTYEKREKKPKEEQKMTVAYSLRDAK